MHHKLAIPVIAALCISSFGIVDAKSSPNWARNNRAQQPAKRHVLPRAGNPLIALVDAVGFDDPLALTNPGPTPTPTPTTPSSTPTDTTATTESNSTGSDSTSQTTAASTDPSTTATPTTSADPSTTTDPTTAPTTTAGPTSTGGGNPISSILSEILDPITRTTSDTPTDTGIIIITSPTEPPVDSGTPTPTDPVTTDPATTDPATTPPPEDTSTATSTGLDVSGILSSILSSLTQTSDPTDTIIGTDGPTGPTETTPTDTGGPTGPTETTPTDTGGPTGPTDGPSTTPTDTAGPTGPTDTVTTTDPGTNTTKPFDPNDSTVFPDPTTTLNPGDASTITSEVPTTLSVPSGFQYLSKTDSLALPSITTSTAVTGIDPDAPSSTVATLEETAAPTSVVVPVNIAMKIVPSENVAAQMTQDDLAAYTPITILFTSAMPWGSVLSSSELFGQVFAYFPGNIAYALGLDPSKVITTSLAAMIPAGWKPDQPDAVNKLLTTFNALIPTEYVPDLIAQLRNPNSKFYKGTVGVSSQLASLVVPTFNIASTDASSGGAVAVGANNPGAAAPTDTSKNTIIGVTTTVGVILVLLIAFFLVKMYKRSREAAHRRLSGEPMTGPAMRSYGSQGFTGGPGGPMGGGSMGRGNRDSFFFAEDSLRGYHGEGNGSVEDDDSYTSHQPTQARRAPIQASAISQPILRESSMGNW